MWTWLGIAVLARVLVASHEMDQYPSTSSFTEDSIVEDVVDGEELQGDELSRESKPKTGTKTRILGWKNGEIFRDMNPYENSIASLIGELSSSDSKIFSNNPKEPEDERDKRSSTKETETIPSGSWMSWMTLQENKAQPFRNLQDPWQEIKKSRAFSPWGGKRVTSFGQGPKVRRPIRVPFNSWGGKRGFSDEEKRARFSSWGGKRGWYLKADENSVENGMEKRTKFNAWGGKRSKNGDRDDEEIKRNRFNAWGGKRNEKTDKRTPEEVGTKKSVFNAWGGKRFFNGDDQVNPGDEKGFKYGSWYDKGGNKNNNNNNNNNNNIFNDKKPGDRIEVVESLNNLVDDNGDAEEIEAPSESEIIELQEKQMVGGEKRNDNIHKSLFNPWGGKKRGENYLDGLNLISPESHHHHARFWPWGG